MAAPYEATKLAKTTSFISRPEHQRIGFVAVLASFLVSLMFFSVLDPYMNAIQSWTTEAKSSLSTAFSGGAASIPQLPIDIDGTLQVHKSHAENPSGKTDVPTTTFHTLVAMTGGAATTNSTTSTVLQAPSVHKRQKRAPNNSTDDVPTTSLRNYTASNPADSEARGGDTQGAAAPPPSIVHVQTNLSALVVSDDVPVVPATTSRGQQQQQGHRHRQWQQPVCDVKDKRSEVCEVDDEPVVINGNASTVIYYTSDDEPSSEWRIRPYARKGDNEAMKWIREVLVKSEPYPLQSPGTQSSICTVNHTVPAVIFSTKGYIGNLFHDFTDIIIPLFLTARRYNGQVQLLATGMNPWWLHKYHATIAALSRYDVIDFDNDHETRCFPHVTVGLHSHKELNIVPSRSLEGYAMPDFTRFLREAYSLDRDAAIRLKLKRRRKSSADQPSVQIVGNNKKKKPRLFLISRKRTRAWMNLEEVVAAAEEAGYEVVAAEANISTNVTRYAQEVNSCDVMLGVHGAGLTNLVFLPPGAVIIQVVPWGSLEGMCKYDFGYPAVDMGLRYLQYSITMEESSLIEKYPRDHPVFTNPVSIHKQGWIALKTTFLDQQNVKIDVRRFKVVLLQALALLGR